jgi:hypothetical protein
MDVPATAVVAAIKSRDLRFMGDLAQDFNKYEDSVDISKL